MTITERVAYIRGLIEGLGLDENSKETKVINAMVELLDDLALAVNDIDENINDLCDELDDMEDAIDCLEDCVYDDDDCCCDCEDDEYELKCSNCGDTVIVDEEMLFSDEEIVCPNCGAKFPDMDIECECGDCDCDCE